MGGAPAPLCRPALRGNPSALCRQLMPKPADQRKLDITHPVELHCFYDAPTHEFRHEKLTVRL